LADNPSRVVILAALTTRQWIFPDDGWHCLPTRSQKAKRAMAKRVKAKRQNAQGNAPAPGDQKRTRTQETTKTRAKGKFC
jgi:hypothetical protein